MNTQYTIDDYYKDQISKMDLDELYEERDMIEMDLEKSFYESKWGDNEAALCEIGELIDKLIEDKQEKKLL